MKNLLIFLLRFINKLFYLRYDVNNSVHNQIVIFKMGFFQKILGFNRRVPWPVHWSSKVIAAAKINPGTRTPGLAKNCHIDGRNGIEFGKNVWIGPDVKIISMNHNVNDYNLYIDAKPINLGDDCWIGAGAIILPEVTLGHHTVVAAGAVVTKSFVRGNQVIGGNPARVLKTLPEYGCRIE